MVMLLNSTFTTLKKLLIPYIALLAPYKVPLCRNYINRDKKKGKALNEMYPATHLLF